MTNYIYNLPLSTVAPIKLQLHCDTQHNSTQIRSYKNLAAQYLMMQHLSEKLQEQDIMKVGFGASKTYLQPKHINYIINPETLVNSPTATLTDNTKMKASTQDIIPLDNSLIPEALVIPSLNN